MTVSSIERICNGAERELQSFLRAVAEIFGAGKTWQAGCLWIEAVKNAGEIENDTEGFFRRITIQVAGQMAAADLPVGGKMKYTTLTVDREFGSGGARIAATIAGWLNWKLLDEEIIQTIASMAKVDKRVVSNYDERAQSWLKRLNEEAIRGFVMASEPPFSEGGIFDTYAMTELTRSIIEDAYSIGNTVIVGRGGQCILAGKPNVFHLFVYAPLQERISRLRKRGSGVINVEHQLRTIDEQRAEYIHQRFGNDWRDTHLYNLMISSQENEDSTARVVLNAMTNGQS